jgi:histidine ammonia-lyase
LEKEKFFIKEKENQPKKFLKEGLEPIQVEIREGLALMNGTSVMSGIGLLMLIKRIS